MFRADLWRSTPFRLALLFTGLFLLSMFVAGLVAFETMGNDLRDRVDTNLAENFRFIAQSYAQSDIEDLVATVQSYAAATRDHDRIYLLAESSGKKLAGNLDTATVPLGLSDARASQLGLATDNSSYRILSGDVAGNRLIVGESYGETTDLQRLTLSSLGWSALIAGAVAILSGLFVAKIVGSRLTAISRTMQLVGRGDLRERIPLRGNNSDLDQLATQINMALARLASLVEGMQQVSVDIAHDLKTPLNRLSITIEDAVAKSEPGGAQTSDLVRAQQEIEQISSTFDALLRIAQLESGARSDHFAPVRIRSVLDLIVEAYQEVATDNGQSFEYACNLGVNDTVLGDRDLLTQLFANLVENAIRHGGAGARIALNASRPGDRISVVLSDTGPGIPEAERDKVFRRMYRLDKSRTTSGTGLGLSLVKAIADLHGAKIALEDNRPGLRIVVDFAV